MDQFGDPSAAARILLVDDQSPQRKALATLLKQEGYHVDEAADGTSAMLILKVRHCDLLLLDLQMPVVDGFEVLKFVRQTLPELPVILLSGMPLDEIGDGIHRVPGQELPPLLLKPIQKEQLLEMIELKLAGEI